MTQAISETTPTRLADATRLGAIELQVSDLDRSIDFYTRIVGMTVHAREGASAALGAGGETIVALHQEPGARPPRREAGLYHFALLFGGREELARVARRVAETRTRIDGASDHRTHEAIYLPDPDGIGVELAADRPRELWPSLDDGSFFGHGPQPLDVRALFATIDHEGPSERADQSLRVGHVHLHVGDLEPATRFYHEGLGFAVMAQMPHAVFVSAGGYHHHVAYNLWRGERVPSYSPDTLGLLNWTLQTTDAAERDAVAERLRAIGAGIEEREDGSLLARDPAGIAVLVK
ncbi:MAG TPA: VOC family protein [Solirubrobacteraceae bacterium]|jgi:catechol 2,3-dioxygenase